MSKYGDIIAEARKPASQQASKPASQQASKSKVDKIAAKKAVGQSKEELKSITVKVALRRRRHWLAQSKLRGESMTETIINALSKRYGEPEE